MTPEEIEEFRERLDGMTEAKIRENVETFPRWQREHKALALEKLRELEEAREEKRHSDAIAVAQEHVDEAREANRLAKIAILISALAAVLAAWTWYNTT